MWWRVVGTKGRRSRLRRDPLEASERWEGWPFISLAAPAQVGHPRQQHWLWRRRWQAWRTLVIALAQRQPIAGPIRCDFISFFFKPCTPVRA